MVAMVERRLPHSEAGYLLPNAFWRPGQEEVLAPYAARYLESVSAIQGGGLLNYGLQMRFYPATAGEEVLDAVKAALAGGTLVPFVHRNLVGRLDTHNRQLTARAR